MDLTFFVVLALLFVAVTVIGTVARGREQRRYQLHELPPADVPEYQERLNSLEGVFATRPRIGVDEAKRLADDLLTAVGVPVRQTDHERLRDLKIIDARSYKGYRDALRGRRERDQRQLQKQFESYQGISRRLLEKAAPIETAAEAQRVD